MAKRDSALAPVVGEQDHVMGPDSADITLVAYCDFECPYCGRAYPIIKGLCADLGNRLRFVFRHFPMSDKHLFAEQAAEAAEAAAAQGRFWPMHDVLFEHQDELAEEDLYGYAGSIGLDLAAFEAALRERVYASRVLRDVLSGRRSGVTGTPTFFINGLSHTDEESLAGIVARLAAR